MVDFYTVERRTTEVKSLTSVPATRSLIFLVDARIIKPNRGMRGQITQYSVIELGSFQLRKRREFELVAKVSQEFKSRRRLLFALECGLVNQTNARQKDFTSNADNSGLIIARSIITLHIKVSTNDTSRRNICIFRFYPCHFITRMLLVDIKYLKNV